MTEEALYFQRLRSIQKTLKEFDIANSLSTRLVKNLSPKGRVHKYAEPGISRIRSSQLEVVITDVNLRAHQQNHRFFSMTMIIRARLRDGATNNVVYDRLLVFAHPKSKKLIPRYFIFLDKSPRTEGLKTFVAADGAEFVRLEIDRAVNACVERILNDLVR